MDGLCSGCFITHFPQPNMKICKLKKRDSTKDIVNSRMEYPKPLRLRGGADNEGNSMSMVNVAIQSAKGHGINLHQGVPNLANGDCMFESIADNISTRSCFGEVWNGTPAHNRKIWMDEAEDLVLQFTGGLGRSEEQFRSIEVI